MSENNSDPMIDRLIDGRYQVRSRIARGGMATVYLANDLRLERKVAIKIMHGHLADDAQFKERFIQEARSAARLAHPNVVNIFDQGQDSDMAYLVMELISGITLRDLLQEHKVLTSEQTLDIMEAVLAGLAAAHKAGIVHRDLKPENVLLADDGRIKIGDFGLARAASANTATGAALLGTIAYLSPELVTRGVADTRSDIYAVGIMMYEMLAGEQPFRGEQPMQIAYQHANDTVPTPSSKNPRVPAELDEIVQWATARDPDQRPRDARAMLDQLLETQRQLESATGATSVMQTMLLPDLETSPGVDTGAETQVLRARVPKPGTGPIAGSVATESTTKLAKTAEKRKARGWWLFALVIILAGVAGGTGWYFGVGPGSHATIPSSIVGTTEDEARAVITELGLAVATKTEKVSSTTVEEGLVVGTDPKVGSPIQRDKTVTIQLSSGPKEVEVPKLAGSSEKAATKRATDAGFIVDKDKRTEQFSGKVDAGNVMNAYGVDDKGDRIKLQQGDTYYDQQPVWFHVSLGPVPSVTGLSVADAIAKLDAVGIDASEGSQEFNDDYAKGEVISAQATEEGAVIKPGSKMLLVVSRGPDVVTIPETNGTNMGEAKSQLEDLGFIVTYANSDSEFAGLILNTIDAKGTNPEAGTDARRGATIELLYDLF